MIYFVVEVQTKWRGHNYEKLETVREDFIEALGFIKILHYLPYEIDTIELKQYSNNNGRVTLLNCFDVHFPGNNMIYEPTFKFYNVSFCV